jgi:hypothetical protein
VQRGPGYLGLEGCEALKAVRQLRAARIAVEGPLQHPVERMTALLDTWGWTAAWAEFRSTEFGETLHRKRWILLTSSGGWEPGEGSDRLDRIRLPVVPPRGPWLRLAKNVKPEEWIVSERLVVDPRVAAAQGLQEPKGASHVWLQG